MNKEEQQQNLYQILLQRNQYNCDAIRKYRRKSNQYFKRVGFVKADCIGGIGDGTGGRDGGAVWEFVGEGRVGVAVGVGDGDKMRMSGGDGEKETLKLPSINPNFHGSSYQLRDSVICSTRRNLGIRTQISMSIVSAKQKQTKATTQLSEDQAQSSSIKQSLTVPPSSGILPQPKPLKPYIRPNFQHHTQSIANKTNSNNYNSNISLTTHTHPHSHNNPNNRNRQSNISTSHKALLNLQEIVFEINSVNPNRKASQSKSINCTNGNNGNNGNGLEGEEAKENNKRIRKYKDKFKGKEKEKEKERERKEMEEKENNNLGYGYSGQDVGKRLSSIEGLQNLATSLIQNNNNSTISILSSSALAHLHKHPTQPNNAINPSQLHPYPSPLPQNPPKILQILPHIRKIKQLRSNLHKLTRPNLSNSHNKITEALTHNHSYSLNGITIPASSNCWNYGVCGIGGHGGSGGHGGTEGLGDGDGLGKMFRIQAVPVQQIRWV